MGRASKGLLDLGSAAKIRSAASGSSAASSLGASFLGSGAFLGAFSFLTAGFLSPDPVNSEYSFWLNSALFVQYSNLPMTLTTFGWLTIVSNHLLTLVYGCL